jgi:type III secretion protein V
MREFYRNLAARPELAIIALMALVIGMLIFPMPTAVLDVLIGINLVGSIAIFVVSFYIARILDFSAFPSALLVTTLFRLALSVSTSRKVLLEADAGHIIDTFGNFVIGGDVVVGIIVFVIVTVIQFIVITKGSERIAEVGARFSLDGMPGKQMSIDSDLRAGVIEADEARDRRRVLEKESQLYGSLDGAMKFIKGDAIAGIIIALVNFVGGIGIGMTRRDMSFSDSLDTYTRLTIGDGLVAQIPALLIAVGAGFVVTRVAEDGRSLGQDLVDQLFGKPIVLLVVAVLCALIGLIPGFPVPVFAGLSALLALAYYRKRRAGEAAPAGGGGATGKASATSKERGGAKGAPSVEGLPVETIPIMLSVPEGSRAAFEREDVAADFQRRVFLDFGLKLPMPVLTTSRLDSGHVGIHIHEIAVTQVMAPQGMYLVTDGADALRAMGYDMIEAGAAGEQPQLWVTQEIAKSCGQNGIGAFKSAVDVLYTEYRCVLAAHINELFGIQETKNLLDEAERRFPELVKEVMRNAPVQRLAEVLQRLINEQVSIRNLKLVLEAVAYWGGKERDTLALVEHVRNALSRYICERVMRAGALSAIAMSPLTEEQFRRAIRQTSNGTFLEMAPQDADAVLESLAASFAKIIQQRADIALLCAADVRRFVKRVIDSRYPEVEVISFGEVPRGLPVNVIDTI